MIDQVENCIQLSNKYMIFGARNLQIETQLCALYIYICTSLSFVLAFSFFFLTVLTLHGYRTLSDKWF